MPSNGRARGMQTVARVAAAVLVAVAAGALASITTAGSTSGAASAAYYGYCPGGGSASVYYGYCPPVNEPPDCSTVTANPATLWPANHKLRLITLQGATDPEGGAVTVTITGVTQDEPLNGTGDGDKSPDAAVGTSSSTVFVRAERADSRDGRVYRIAFTAADGDGGTCTGTVKVAVPGDQSGSAAVDSAPPSFNSFGP
jgi:hypothetical protein